MNKNKVVSCLAVVSLTASGVATIGVQNNVYANTQKEVTATWLTVRTGASPDHKEVDWIKKGTDVTVLSSKSGWDYIQYDGGKKGYVYNQYLKTITSTSVSSGSVYRSVTAYWLTMRSGAGANYKAVDYLKKGTNVKIISYHGEWAKVQAGSKTGYVHEGYLSGKKGSASSSSTTAPSTSETKTVTAYWLTMRSGAGADYKAIDYLKKGTKVTVKSYKGDWAYVNVNGKNGYVHKSYLSGSAATKPSTPSTPANPAPSSSTYKVASGDTLWSISRKYSMTVENLKALNGLSSNVLRVGQILKVSGKATTPSTPKPSGVLSGKEIVIDPGHGGRFAGAHGIVHEEDVNLQISLKVRDYLQSMGAKVIMTRSSDVACTPAGYTYSQDLACRPGVAKSNKSNMFVSIHSNAGASSAYGTETYYRNSNRGDYKLANAIYDQLVATGDLRGRKVKYADFAVLRHSPSNIPSALVEVGFVTNRSDAAKLGSASHQNKFAQAIANGIANYYR